MRFCNTEYDTQRVSISAKILEYLSKCGIRTHLIYTLNRREQLVESVEQCAVFVQIHSIASKNLQTKFGIKAGTILSHPLLEWYMNSKKLNNPLISSNHIIHFQWLTKNQIQNIVKTAQRIHDIVKALLQHIKLQLSSQILKFGFINNELVLIDEISPERCDFINENGFLESSNEVYEKFSNANWC